MILIFFKKTISDVLSIVVTVVAIINIFKNPNILFFTKRFLSMAFLILATRFPSLIADMDSKTSDKHYRWLALSSIIKVLLTAYSY